MILPMSHIHTENTETWKSLKKKNVEIACLFTVLYKLQIIYSLRNYCLVRRANGTYQQLHNHGRLIAVFGSRVEQKTLLIERESGQKTRQN